MENIVPLELMAIGETGRVFHINGPTALVHRLAEMGLSEQSPVRMVQPGRPCIVAINDHRFSFRADDEVEVLVALGKPAEI